MKSVILSSAVIAGLVVGYFGSGGSVSALSHAGEGILPEFREDIGARHIRTATEIAVPALEAPVAVNIPAYSAEKLQAPVLYIPDQWIYATAPHRFSSKKPVDSRKWVCEEMRDNYLGGRSALCLPTR